MNLGGPKRVNTLRFPLEKHFESLAIRVVVDELSDSEIGFVIPDRIIDLQSQFQIHNVAFKALTLFFRRLKLLKQVQCCHVRFV